MAASGMGIIENEGVTDRQQVASPASCPHLLPAIFAACAAPHASACTLYARAAHSAASARAPRRRARAQRRNGHRVSATGGIEIIRHGEK